MEYCVRNRRRLKTPTRPQPPIVRARGTVPAMPAMAAMPTLPLLPDEPRDADTDADSGERVIAVVVG